MLNKRIGLFVMFIMVVSFVCVMPVSAIGNVTAVYKGMIMVKNAKHFRLELTNTDAAIKDTYGIAAGYDNGKLVCVQKADAIIEKGKTNVDIPYGTLADSYKLMVWTSDCSPVIETITPIFNNAVNYYNNAVITKNGLPIDIADGNFTNLIDHDETTSVTTRHTYTNFKIDLGNEYRASKVRVKTETAIGMVYYGYQDSNKNEVEILPKVDPDKKNGWVANSGWCELNPPTADIRYMYVQADVGGETISEIEILTYDNLIIPNNIALGKSITASEGGWNNSTVMVDGNVDTFGTATGLYTHATIDLGTEYNIAGARLKYANSNIVYANWYKTDKTNPDGQFAFGLPEGTTAWMGIKAPMFKARTLDLFFTEKTFANVYEIEIYTYDEPIVPKNIALGKSINVKQGALLNAAAMLDGDESTVAVTNAKWTQPWVDLGAEYTIVSARIKHTTKDERVYYFYFDSLETAISTGNNDTYVSKDGWINLNVPTAPVRYFAFQPDPIGCGIAELEIYAFSRINKNFVTIKSNN